MSFAYVASYVRAVYEDETWWQENKATSENNFTFISRLEEVIELIHKKLPGKKHKHIYPRDTNIIEFIRQTEQKKKRKKILHQLQVVLFIQIIPQSRSYKLYWVVHMVKYN